MSICTGAFVLAKTGLLSGKSATTHHGAHAEFAATYPDINVKREVALRTAEGLEYQGLGWLNADSNSAYAKRRVSTDAHPLCAVCEMDVADRATAPTLHLSRRNVLLLLGKPQKPLRRGSRSSSGELT